MVDKASTVMDGASTVLNTIKWVCIAFVVGIFAFLGYTAYILPVGFGGGLIMAILFPVANGVGGLVGGALISLLYNFVAKFVGGIKFEI